MDFLPNCKTENTKKTVLLDFSRWMFFQEAKKDSLKTSSVRFCLDGFLFQSNINDPPPQTKTKKSYLFPGSGQHRPDKPLNLQSLWLRHLRPGCI